MFQSDSRQPRDGDLANIGENDSAGYRYIIFDGTERFFDLHVGTPSDAGSVEVRLDSRP